MEGQLSLDFVGYTTGKPFTPEPALAGYIGLLDFAGYPVGNTFEVPPQPVVFIHRGGTKKKIKDDEVLLMV